MSREGRCRYRNWTDEERNEICNGCGGTGSRIPVPNFMFGASCDQHDANYWIGGNERDREKADRQFYSEMVKDVYRLSWWRWPIARFLARRYYRAVRVFGKNFFAFGRQRGWEELDSTMARARRLRGFRKDLEK